MEYNKSITISIGGSRKDMHWKADRTTWKDFAERLGKPVRGTETLEEYLRLPKARQDELKDVGGFVGGTLAGERRKADRVVSRDLITLDLDSIPAGGTADIIKRIGALGCAAAVYSTRKHSGYAPRLRVVIPLDQSATADEYEPAARKLAQIIGMELCDPTTFEASRLMYWPSACRDAEYVCEIFDRPFCSKDGILQMYGDWTDMSQWPQVPGSEALERKRLAKQEDPTVKKGAVGAFCRTYNILGAMEKFIPGIYEETDTPGRYTYTGGSTTGGAVIYDNDKFLYSHHATDPCSGLLVNAFDLVRLHKFGDLDDEAAPGTPACKLPSYTAMSRFALEDDTVSALMASERHEEAREAFAQPAGEVEDLDWMSQLKRTESGTYAKTMQNIVTILRNDPWFKDKIVTDEFSGRGLILGAMPWDPSEAKRIWRDFDDAGLYWYMETSYGITGQDKISNALTVVAGQHKINEVADYLESLHWDGVERIGTLLPDYLGAEDSQYTRIVMRKMLAGAVARAIEGGIKFDYLTILAGPQGIGKSTFLATLGKNWFSDSLTTFEGKDAAELIQGVWIVEVGELTAMNRQESNAVKQFLSKKDDIYRAAYGRRTEKYPRRCVFFGTTNEKEFLKDATGERRFWPVDVGLRHPVKNVWRDLPKEVDQIWAEAYVLYILGAENLFMTSGEEESLAKMAQESHRERSEKEGFIRDFLDREIPESWWSLSIDQQRQYMGGFLKVDAPLVERDRTCVAEIWAVCFSGDKKFLKKSESQEINRILLGMQEWKKTESGMRFGNYGIQRGFKKV